MPETLGDRIRMHRARLRLSQTDLGKRIGVSTNSVSAIESGRTDPRVSLVRRIAKVLGVSVDYLLGDVDEQSESLPAAVAMVGA